jgi:hypothetical protein
LIDVLQGPLLPEFEKILPDAFAQRVKREGVDGVSGPP